MRHTEERKVSISESIKMICQMLYGLGVTKINIRYAGSGDSGSIESITYFKGKDELSDEEVKKLPSPAQDHELTQRKDIGDFLGDATDWIDGDWYNNEGGQGNIIIHTKTLKVIIEAEYNITEITTETQEFKL